VFLTTYQESRARFRTCLDSVRARWPGARLESYALRDHPELSIDWIAAEAFAPRRLCVLTTGLHGIEGYVGAAMLELFVAEFMPHLDPQDTGLLLVHAVNPWGMAHHQRCNAQHVDLNRNFLARWEGMRESNPEYDRVWAFLHRPRPLGSWALANLRFLGGVVRLMMELGVSRAREAILSGQYRHSQGFYYGGTETQEEARALITLQEEALARYDRIVHLDMHTGYGPRMQMSVVNSSCEPGPSEEWQRNLRYPRVVRTDPAEFYTIHGDMTAYWYELRDARFPGKQVYAASFEFGTFGDALPAEIRSLRASVLQNQLEGFGASNRAAGKRMRREYEEQYNPSDTAWREKALGDARRAFQGILAFFGLVA
jgi:predicted deacylase